MSVDTIRAFMAVSFLCVLAKIGQIIMRPSTTVSAQKSGETKKPRHLIYLIKQYACFDGCVVSTAPKRS